MPVLKVPLSDKAKVRFDAWKVAWELDLGHSLTIPEFIAFVSNDRQFYPKRRTFK